MMCTALCTHVKTGVQQISGALVRSAGIHVTACRAGNTLTTDLLGLQEHSQA